MRIVKIEKWTKSLLSGLALGVFALGFQSCGLVEDKKGGGFEEIDLLYGLEALHFDLPISEERLAELDQQLAAGIAGFQPALSLVEIEINVNVNFSSSEITLTEVFFSDPKLSGAFDCLSPQAQSEVSWWRENIEICRKKFKLGAQDNYWNYCPYPIHISYTPPEDGFAAYPIDLEHSPEKSCAEYTVCPEQIEDFKNFYEGIKEEVAEVCVPMLYAIDEPVPLPVVPIEPIEPVEPVLSPIKNIGTPPVQVMINNFQGN